MTFDESRASNRNVKATREKAKESEAEKRLEQKKGQADG